MGGKYLVDVYSSQFMVDDGSHIFLVGGIHFGKSRISHATAAQEVPVPDFKDMEGQIVKAQWREVGFRQPGGTRKHRWMGVVTMVTAKV